MKKSGFFTSSWDFTQEERDLRSKFQMINIAIVLSTVSLLYGILGNAIRETYSLIPLESFLILINFVLFMVLRRWKNSFKYVALIETVQFTFLFLFLVYTTAPEALKHVWVFTYPIVLLYFQNEKNATYWLALMIGMLLIAPLQPFVNVAYSFYQVSYISFVLLVISVIIYFYQKKMDEAQELIVEQQKIMSVQSKHAVMGEMISMIAHQWRQPLSTVTLSVSNIQIKKLLGEKIDEDSFDKTLEDISNTVVYLSQTIDDFQTFFNPKREIIQIELDELINRAISFTTARIKNTTIKIVQIPHKKIELQTYANELVQVILNILNNAVDVLIAKEIQTPKIIIEVVDIGSEIKIIITDNAGGIKEKDIENIFEPYFSTKGKNGTGLGLYMSQMIMLKQFNTKIDVSNSENGATFAIIVPKKLA